LLVRADGPDGWTRGPNLGFAHGRAGIFHALLSWSIACGRALPTAFARHLDRLAADVERTGTMGAPRAQLPGQGAALARSWCNGAAGLALLWARAYEHAPRAAYLGRARAAATFVLDEVAGAPGHLCCGLAGRAYALLAMERIEPGRWIARAEAMAAAATTAVLAQRSAWPNGLLTGYPGLVCLARELDAAPADRIGFPLVEGA
jgi:serine/threonine-protein kinase